MRATSGGGERASPRASQTGRLAFAVLAAVFAILTFVPSSASADGLDDLCKEVPAPVRPDYQVAGLIMDKPDLAKVPDAAPDPFKDGAVPISDVYGWAWRYTNYDLGCGSDFIRDPNAVASTSVANLAMAGLATIASAVDSTENMAQTATFDWVRPVVGKIGGSLQDRVLTVWLPIALLLVSIVAALGATKASYSETFRRLLVVVACVVLAVVALVFPIQATNAMDKVATSLSAAAQGGFTNRASDLITRESVYQTWLVGNFGSADSATAQEYGPRLMSALTYSWSDVKRMTADPKAQEAIDKAKATEFKTIATELQKKDPAAYQSMTGKADTRTAATILGSLWVLIMGFFVTVASLITVVARLIMMGLVVAAMVGSVVGLLKFAVLQRMWDLFTAALINTAKFTIAAGAMTLILGAIQAAPVSTGWRLLFTIIVTVIAVMLTKPAASFKSMAGMDANNSVVGGLLRRAAGTALGVIASRKVDGDASPEMPASPGQPTVVTLPRPARYQPVEPSMPPLPAPKVQGAYVVAEVEKPGWAGAQQFALDRGRPAVVELPPRVDRHAALPAASTQPALEPSPMTLHSGQDHDWPRAAPALPIPPGTQRIGTHRDGTQSQKAQQAPFQPHAGVLTNGEVVYPTGVVVARDARLYRSGEGVVQPEEYVRFPEPQVDANGDVTWVPLYHARPGR